MKSHLLFVVLPLSCFCDSVFDRIGNGYYFIESEHLVSETKFMKMKKKKFFIAQNEHYFDWFFAWRDCWRHVSNLVSIETVEELKDLEQYVLSKGYAEGTTFATSGHSFRTAPDFWWDGADEAVTLNRWLPGKQKPSKKSYLSLQLINSTLYMLESFGQDDYFICEYTFSAPRVWMSLNESTRIIVLLALMLISVCMLYNIVRTKKHSEGGRNDEEKLITESKCNLRDSTNQKSKICTIPIF